MGQPYEFETTPERSKLMKKIRLRNTQPELLLRKELTRRGFRYRINSPTLPGKPDIVLRRFHLVIFVDGEFWHGFNWDKKKPRIKSNREYWIPKIERTMERDKRNNEMLQDLGFHVLRFWEQQVRKELDACIQIIESHCVR